jgi:methyl-accepting chemotaxis protein
MFEKDPRTFEADIKGLSPEQKAMVKLEITLTRFFKSLDTSINRWERLFYPAMLVMALLGLSGFYLIYHVTQDMKTMTQHIDPNMAANLDAMSSHMGDLSRNISTMTGQISIMVEKIESMDSHIVSMDSNIEKITTAIDHVQVSLDSMTRDMNEMNLSTWRMSKDLNQLGRPMDFMNSFSPW